MNYRNELLCLIMFEKNWMDWMKIRFDIEKKRTKKPFPLGLFYWRDFLPFDKKMAKM